MRLGVGTWSKVQPGGVPSFDREQVDGCGLPLIATVSGWGFAVLIRFVPVW